MAENQGMYGFADDNVARTSSFTFGGNFGTARLVKFEHILNGGKGGQEQEALEIVFNIGGQDKGYRQFPPTKVFKDNVEITDKNSPEYKAGFEEARHQLSQLITHILKAFVAEEDVRQAFARPINSFKEYCNIAAGLLPKDFQEKPLDIFMQWQWNIKGDKNRTYLELPKNLKYGKFVVAAQAGKWEKVVTEDDGLKYVNEAGEIHPFTRSAYYMSNNFARQQKDDDSAGDTDSSSETTGSEQNQARQGSGW